MPIACAPVEIKSRAWTYTRSALRVSGWNMPAPLSATQARFTVKNLCRRLACQASVSQRDPILSSTTTVEPQPGVDEEDTPEPEIRHWGSTLDLLDPLTEPPLMLDYEEEDESDGKDCLLSDGDDEDFEFCFVPPAQALRSPSFRGLG
ncbi:unnamed protein product [Pleuronectes platessa]|uniref:Uncharacterized protein n=1 Tax=Pleuronectes platessa TaxID=8262 RepID=A0A9N7VY56_PLEPL|nr:unnamed protein product [Pleuronectes platessa]